MPSQIRPVTKMAAIFKMAAITYLKFVGIVGYINSRGGNVFPLYYKSYISNFTVHITVEIANNY